MRCECILKVSKVLGGVCDHAVGKCKNKSKVEFVSPGRKLQLCFGCNRQYSKRWRPYSAAAKKA